MPLLLLFIDGIGLAPRADSNPFSTLPLPGFAALSAGTPWTSDAPGMSEAHGLFRGIDACLGVPGLPQSGTGQSTLFTGVNCAALAGRHYGPWPHSTSRPVLRDRSLFLQVKGLPGGTACFANAYPDRFFEISKARDRWSTTTRSCLDAGVPLHGLDRLAAGEALAADLTGRGLQRFDASVQPVSEETAAIRLIRLADTHSLTVFEYFHTDKAGHARSASQGAEVLTSLSRFLASVLEQRPERLSVVLTSDHGNLEDLSVRTHTRNPVPLAVAGPAAGFFRDVTDLTGITPAILRSLRNAEL